MKKMSDKDYEEIFKKQIDMEIKITSIVLAVMIVGLLVTINA